MQSKQQKIRELLQAGNISQALSMLRKVNGKKQHRCFTTLDWEGVCNAKLKQWNSAINAWQSALLLTSSIQEKTALYWKMILASEQQGNVEQLKDFLEKSLGIDSSLNNANPRMKLCELSFKLGDYVTVEELTPRLLDLDSAAFPALGLLTRNAAAIFDKPLVMERLKKMIDIGHVLKPQHIGFIAHQYIKINEYTHADIFLTGYAEHYDKDAWYCVLKSLILFEQEQYTQVIALLSNKDVTSLPLWFKEDGLYYIALGKSYDKLGMFSKSFRCFENMASASEKKYSDYDKLNLVDAYRKIKHSDIPQVPYTHTQSQPVFMLGFPRSGTTLLENLLDTQGSIETLSEPDTISSVTSEISKIFNNVNYPNELHRLTENQVFSLRDLYFSKVDNLVEKSTISNVLIDKMPLYSLYIPVIKMLFPEAKFIINIRHPFDVVLSNFQQNYTVNNEMAFLFTIKDCVARYNEVMSFLDELKNEYSLNLIQIRYEDLISDLKKETNRLFEFLALDNVSDVGDFHLMAKQKVINTPSSSQVTKPLYNDSKFKWKNYQKQLSPYADDLKYFIDKYGYTV